MEIEQQIKKQGYVIVEMTRDQVQQYESLDTKYNAIVLCDRGSAVVEVNMRRVEMGERSCTFWHHVFYMGTVHVSEDFHAWVLVVSDTFSNTVSVGIPLELIQSLVTQGPRRKLTDDEWQLFESFMRSIRLYDRMGMSQHSYEVAGGVLRSMIIALAEMNTAHGEEIKANYNMADNYFRRFVT
ncbi:MAG: hypothetical protein IK092_04270, partial [Muribaculaceae bacterium]|nr:hypothetical protein [Muribaculaceae bacterium]